MRAASAHRLALFGIGAALAIAGIVNLTWPLTFFPSEQTCVTDHDLTVCEIHTWTWAPLIAVGGIALMVLAVWRVIRR